MIAVAGFHEKKVLMLPGRGWNAYHWPLGYGILDGSVM
jgi:hypothetical protein